MIYLDYHATSPLRKSAALAVKKWMDGDIVNPHSRDYKEGIKAGDQLEKARESLSKSIGAKSSEITFTSGATEANNLALFSISRALEKSNKKKIIVGSCEHPSVLVVAQAISRQGFKVEQIKVKNNGLIDIDYYKSIIDESCGIVSVMLANNEIGVIQDIKALAKIANSFGAHFHCDAVQGLGRVPLDVKDLGVDSLSISGHKIGALPGTGALWLKESIKKNLQPITYGGGQEGNLRSGTVSLPAVISLGAAVTEATAEREKESIRLRKLRDQLLNQLQSIFSDLRVNGDLKQRLANNLHISIPCASCADTWLKLSDKLAVSRGSACSKGTGNSYVLRALGVPQDELSCSIRFGLGFSTTAEDINKAVKIIANAFNR